jgi:hypothetical protein
MRLRHKMVCRRLSAQQQSDVCLRLRLHEDPISALCTVSPGLKSRRDAGAGLAWPGPDLALALADPGLAWPGLALALTWPDTAIPPEPSP